MTCPTPGGQGEIPPRHPLEMWAGCAVRFAGDEKSFSSRLDWRDIPMAENGLMIPETLSPLAVFGEEGGVDKIIERLRTDALAQAATLGIETEAGRKALNSLAFKVTRSKTALDDMGKSLVEDQKRRLAKIDQERRRIRDECDKIRDEVRKPLDDYEAEVKAFNDKWRAETITLEALGEGLDGAPGPDIRDRLRRLAVCGVFGPARLPAQAGGLRSRRPIDGLDGMSRRRADDPLEK